MAVMMVSERSVRRAIFLHAGGHNGMFWRDSVAEVKDGCGVKERRLRLTGIFVKAVC